MIRITTVVSISDSRTYRFQEKNRPEVSISYNGIAIAAPRWSNSRRTRFPDYR